ncbi:unnamed protein product [marine sediment metagenome]|uniref:Uncharacterized protein n=1 Tax=marine sediment metagenome TaxID=412755 RepID=X1FJD2_9ZZZZ
MCVGAMPYGSKVSQGNAKIRSTRVFGGAQSILKYATEKENVLGWMTAIAIRIGTAQTAPSLGHATEFPIGTQVSAMEMENAIIQTNVVVIHGGLVQNAAIRAIAALEYGKTIKPCATKLANVPQITRVRVMCTKMVPNVG